MATARRASTTLLAVGLAAVVLLTGCSRGGAAPHDDSRETAPAEPTPTAEAVAEVREFWPLGDGDVRMPQFIGMHLDEAEALAKRLRLVVDAEDDHNERGIWASGNWTVVWQEEPAGSVVRENSYLDLRALKHGEAADAVEAALAVDFHVEESSFTGEITGYVREDTVDVSTVLVDGAPVVLDLVQPLAPGCGQALKEGLEEAALALERELPIGQRVLVVRSEERSPHGFIHVLASDGEPAVDPPADSVNERLVLTGWWVPDSLRMEGGIGLQRHGAASVAFEPYSPRFAVRSQAVPYLPFIAQAGDEAVEQYLGTAGDCRRAAEADRDAYVAAWIEEERQREADRAEFWRLYNSGYFTQYCRDGDGDGVCYER